MPARRQQPLLEYSYDPKIKYEICLDEVGRGPLFGRLYTGAVVIKRDGSFDRLHIKDSKKFTSKEKIKEVASYIKENAICSNIHYIESNVIDEINILQAVYKSMHENIRSILDKLILIDPLFDYNDVLIVVDGDRFTPFNISNAEFTA
jgi:ribonuclease HII